MTSREPKLHAERQRDTWEGNAAPWTKAVREGRIASRRVTDAAIVRAVEASGARRVLDVGCGEGWLARTLAEKGCDVTGFDASASLIASAQQAGEGRFVELSYEALVAEPDRLPADFDAVVCNFSLLDEQIVPLLHALRTRLGPSGHLLIQTVHPLAVGGPYRDGWREESFDAFGPGFAEPMPWYFRTVGAWVDALRRAGFVIERCVEPVEAESDEPFSLLLTCSPGPMLSG